MVLFYEHENKPEPTRLRRWAGRIFWTLVVVAGMTWIGLVLISRQSGPDSPVCRGIEDYFSRLSGGTAHIAECRYASLYPYIAADIGGLEMSGPNTGNVAVTSAKVATGFWDAFFSRRRFYEVDIAGLSLHPTDKAGEMKIPEFRILDNPPRLHIKALSQGQALDATLSLRRWAGRGGRPVYGWQEHAGLMLALPGITAKGRVHYPSSGVMDINFTEISVAGRKIQADIRLARAGQGHVRLIAAIKGQKLYDLLFDMNTERTQASLSAETFEGKDLAALRAIWRGLSAFLPPAAASCYEPLFTAGQEKSRIRTLLKDGTCRSGAP